MRAVIEYEHTQKGTLTRVLMGLMLCFFVATSAHAFIVQGKEVWAMLFAPTVLLLVLLLFHQLTVSVDENQVRVSFGIGLIHKSFFVDDIERASAVRTHWYNGWGIRMIRGGWLYNISGYDAVQLNMRNGKVVQIGTDEQALLLEAIEKAMAFKNRV